MTVTGHDTSAKRDNKVERRPAVSQFYRVFHFGTEVEPPKAADIEIQGEIVVAAHQPLAFMIGWTIEKVLERLVQHKFKFCTLPGMSRTSLFVTKSPSKTQRRLAKRAANVSPSKPESPAKPVIKRAKIKVPKPAPSAAVSIPNSMASLPKTVFSMGKRVS